MSQASSATNQALPTSGTASPHIRIISHIDTQGSLQFEAIDRDVPERAVVKIGRFITNQSSATSIVFNSKAVSRAHAEIWTESGRFYIRDTKSFSGTFLNQVRLSPPHQESRPFALTDGDVVQLGEEDPEVMLDAYRCVRMRVELTRPLPPQRQSNPRRLNPADNILRTIINPTNPTPALPLAPRHPLNPCDQESCCICLDPIAPSQALFTAPCSHAYHYKCIMPLLQEQSGFLCPLCRRLAVLHDKEDEIIEDEIIEDEHQTEEALAEARPPVGDDADVTSMLADGAVVSANKPEYVANPPATIVFCMVYLYIYYYLFFVHNNASSHGLVG